MSAIFNVIVEGLEQQKTITDLGCWYFSDGTHIMWHMLDDASQQDVWLLDVDYIIMEI